jgi:hypothetical protein
MGDLLTYCALASMILLVLSGTIARYTSYKLMRYIQHHYPELAEEFGYRKGVYYNEFKHLMALLRKQDIDDPNFMRLKTNAKRAQVCALMVFTAIVVLIIAVTVTMVFG